MFVSFFFVSYLMLIIFKIRAIMRDAGNVWHEKKLHSSRPKKFLKKDTWGISFFTHEIPCVFSPQNKRQREQQQHVDVKQKSV